MAENILDSVGNIHKLKSFSCLDRELPCCIPIPPPMSTTAYVLINGIISTNLHFMKSTADAASCGRARQIIFEQDKLLGIVT